MAKQVLAMELFARKKRDESLRFCWKLPLFYTFGICVIVLGGCVSTGDKESAGDGTGLGKKPGFTLSTGERTGGLIGSLAKKPDIGLKERMILEPATTGGKEKKKSQLLYSFRADAMPIVDALALFARTNNLNIVPDPEVLGSITVDFKNLPFEKAMEAILDAHGYSAELKQGLIRVHKFITRQFEINYIRLIRSGKSSSKAQITSGSSGGGEGGVAGSLEVSQEDKISFWEELEEQLDSMISDEGGVVVNRTAGIVRVTDNLRSVNNIGKFLDALILSVVRQVEIEVKIYEVTLDDEYSLGLDWTKIGMDSGFGALSTANIITSPFGGASAKGATSTVTYNRGDFDGVLRAMKEQGEIRVVSKPRLLTLNNQPAFIKVGTDMPFFEATTNIDPTSGRPTTTYTTSFVTIGVVLSVTPQISSEGYIMLDITPIVTRLVGTRSLIDPETGRELITAPVVDVKQSSTVVRLRDSEMAIIGGLIQDETSETERKVPLLGDLPWIGKLFSGTYKMKVKREIVVFLTPRLKKI